MADIQVNISPEDINKAVAQKVVDSIIGTTLADEVTKKFTTGSYGQNLIEGIVNQILKEVAINYITEAGYKQKLEDKIKEVLSDDIMNKLVLAATEKLKRGY